MSDISMEMETPAEEKLGEIRINDDVIAAIAGIAATEVEGVNSMVGNMTGEIIGKLGYKSLSKGVRVDVEEGKASIILSLNIEYSFNIPDVSRKVQERVKSVVESMTGLEVTEVTVRIAGVNLE